MTRNPRSLRSSWRFSIADPIGLWVLTSGLLALLCMRIFACVADCVSPERRLCSHTLKFRMCCRLFVAGTALAVEPSYLMYLGHILL